MPNEAQDEAESKARIDEGEGEGRSPRGEAPRVFISYTHENPEHKQWVLSLATDLRKEGVDAILDQWEMGLGKDVTLFMEQGIRGAKRVLLVCTPAYARKANEGEGGVGYERLVVTGELAKKIDTSKFVCVLRAGTKEDAVPTFAQSRVYIDFTDGVDYDLAMEELLRDLHEAPANPKPPLGPNPFLSGAQPSVAQPAGLVATECEPGLDISEVARRAEKLLRQKDILGWQRFIRSVRRRYPGEIARWRERASMPMKVDDAWHAELDRATDVTAPLIVLALTAIESGIEEVRNQVSLLDELLVPENWPRSGWEPVVCVPELLAMVYHHLAGSLYLAAGDYGGAAALLTARITDCDDPTSCSEVWRQRSLMGWTKSLGGDVARSWWFLRRLHASHKWVTGFFLSERAYLLALRSYELLGSLLELGDLAATGKYADRSDDFGFMPHVPPMFLDPANPQDVGAVIRQAIPNRGALQLVASNCGISPKDLVALWPGWFMSLVRWHGRSGNMRIASYFRAAPPLL